MVYLDNAATTFKKPSGVYRAMVDCMMNYGANPGRAGHKMAIKLSEKVFEARCELSSLFNISDPSRMIFTFNATDALNTAISGVCKAGDHVIISSMEHNSVLRPVHGLSLKGVEYDICTADVYGKVKDKDIEKKIKDNTVLCVLIHASNVCGTINDIASIGKLLRKKGVLFLVDASQSAGIIDIDVQRDNIDILAFAGHKALMGPQGTGGLYIGERANVLPLRLGGTGSSSLVVSQPEEFPDKYESGTLNGVGIAGLLEGVRFVRENGIDNLFAYETELCEMALSDLSVMKNVNVMGYLSTVSRCGVISFVSDKIHTGEIARRMDMEYDIALRAGYHCAPFAHKTLGTYDSGTVRLSIGAFNTKKEIKYFSECLNKVINHK